MEDHLASAQDSVQMARYRCYAQHDRLDALENHLDGMEIVLSVILEELVGTHRQIDYLTSLMEQQIIDNHIPAFSAPFQEVSEQE